MLPVPQNRHNTSHHTHISHVSTNQHTSIFTYELHYAGRVVFDLLYWVIVPLLSFNMLLGKH